MSKNSTATALDNHLPEMQPIDPRESTSLFHLMFWVANEQNVHQETVQAMFEAKFGLDDFSKLQKMRYDDAIKFLVDLQVAELMH